MSDDNGVSVTRRRVVGSLVTVGVASTAAGAGTMAWFQDTESSTGNTVQAGTLDLQLGDDDEGIGSSPSGVTGTFSVSNIKPTERTSGMIQAQNGGSIAGDHLEIQIEADGSEASGPNGSNEADTAPDSGDGFAKLFEVTQLSYPEQGSNSLSLLDRVNDQNGNGIKDLDDVAQHGVFDDLKPAPQPGGMRTFSLSAKFIDTGSDHYDGTLTNNDFQGDELSITVTMALAQESGQDVL